MGHSKKLATSNNLITVEYDIKVCVMREGNEGASFLPGASI